MGLRTYSLHTPQASLSLVLSQEQFIRPWSELPRALLEKSLEQIISQGPFHPKLYIIPSIRTGMYQFSGLFCHHPNHLHEYHACIKLFNFKCNFKKGIIMMHCNYNFQKIYFQVYKTRRQNNQSAALKWLCLIKFFNVSVSIRTKSIIFSKYAWAVFF